MTGLDTEAVAQWMAAAVPGFQGPLQAERLTGGQSNPTFALASPSGAYVLRRKPPGALLKSAHAVEREFRVQDALYGSEVPVPRMFGLCEDTEVIGSAFYVMERVVGRGFDDPRLPSVERPERLLYFNDMARVLAAIHQVDLGATGLADYGPKGNYFRRQIDRWTKQYRASALQHLPEMDTLMATLDRLCPEDDGRVTLVHGDYRIDNLLFDMQAPRIAAVLDWELSTLGHPYADLASVIMQWRMPPGEQGRGLKGVDRSSEGLMTDDAFIDSYFEHMGEKRIEEFGVFVAFSFFRMAAILQGVLKRAEDGTASDPERGRRLGALVPDYARAGLDALDA